MNKLISINLFSTYVEQYQFIKEEYKDVGYSQEKNSKIKEKIWKMREGTRRIRNKREKERVGILDAT